jgi:hypothetical protein
MIVRYSKDIETVGTREEDKTAAPQKGAHEHSDTCRCQETSKMTPKQLLGLMMSDLAFWKKTRKQRTEKR